ncbi:hypothetical protein PGTUg99_018862 [Puccinia graminis f. sp. tritici]|uniref:Uncharacterized protein n=1 Tax=Puccinia graminis f. sp. tritici TaxID=56615 RepID=A0A5B0Q1K3_PUCGR|nr:hypothetical protein PGTUg99_018862 [Puccinia graminis f. sp. tritici]
MTIHDKFQLGGLPTIGPKKWVAELGASTGGMFSTDGEHSSETQTGCHKLPPREGALEPARHLPRTPGNQAVKKL